MTRPFYDVGSNLKINILFSSEVFSNCIIIMLLLGVSRNRNSKSHDFQRFLRHIFFYAAKHHLYKNNIKALHLSIFRLMFVSQLPWTFCFALPTSHTITYRLRQRIIFVWHLSSNAIAHAIATFSTLQTRKLKSNQNE